MTMTRHEARVKAFEPFFRIGASVSLTEWLRLPDESRAAMSEAADRVWVERLSDVATALGSPLGPEALRARLDGGESHDDALILAAVDAIAEARNG